MSVTIDDVVLSLLRFEHRYIPYEGMSRRELFARAMADMGHDVDPAVMFDQARSRVVDMIDDALAGEQEAVEDPDVDEVTDDDLRRITLAATASTAWLEGFVIGIYHARQLQGSGS